MKNTYMYVYMYHFTYIHTCIYIHINIHIYMYRIQIQTYMKIGLRVYLPVADGTVALSDVAARGVELEGAISV